MKYIEDVMKQLIFLLPEIDDGFEEDRYEKIIHVNDCISLHYDEDPNEITKISMLHPSPLYGFHLKIEDIFDIENSNFYFENFDEAKNFVKKHGNFPKKLFWNKNGYITFHNGKNGDLLEIPDITKYHLVTKTFVEED